MLNFFFGNSRKVKCPDGNVVFVVRNIDDAMPLHLRSHSIKTGAKADAGELGSANANAEYGSTISNILFAINDRNASQAFDFRSAYLVYMADPCKNADLLARIQNKIMDDRVRLEELQIKSQTLIELARSKGVDSTEVRQLSMELSETLKLPSPSAAAAAIEDAKSDARDMLGGSTDD